MLRPLFTGQALALDLDLPVYAVTVAGDRVALGLLTRNLLDNALAYGGPAITVTLQPGPVLDVADDGPGIPPEEREQVIRRFYRLDRSRSTPGTGLGLALVAAAARLHGGALQLGAATADGTGLRARVDLRGAGVPGGQDAPGA